MKNLRVFRIFICFTLVLGLIGVASFAQEDLEKKYADLIGDYEIDMEGQIMIVSFWVEEGKFLAAPEGQADAAELNPVEGEPLKFEINTPDGQYFEITFEKNDAGKVTQCIINAMGMEMVGVKIKK